MTSDKNRHWITLKSSLQRGWALIDIALRYIYIYIHQNKVVLTVVRSIASNINYSLSFQEKLITAISFSQAVVITGDKIETYNDKSGYI